MQAGYASGMVLICPLADVLPRRPFILLLVAVTAVMARRAPRLSLE